MGVSLCAKDRLSAAAAESKGRADPMRRLGVGESRWRITAAGIDHINGNRLDDRRGNLRHLCPNCHSMAEIRCRGKHRRTPRRDSA